MSLYKNTSTGSIQFDDQAVAYEVRRLTTAEAIEARKLDAAQIAKFVRDRVMTLGAIRDPDGNEASQDVVFDDFYFAPLITELVNVLFASGKIPKAFADPSAGNSSTSSTGEISQ